MTFIFDVNSAPTTGTEVVFKFKTLVKNAGWTVKASGDGSAIFSSTTDIINSSSSGANGLGNSNAWYRFQDAGGGREFCIQRGASSTQWKVKYSAQSKFTTGGSATVMPTATDEKYVLGTSGSFDSWTDTDLTYRWNAGSDGYSFWSVGTKLGNNNPNFSMIFILDIMVSGTYNVSDVDPAIVFCRNSGATAFSVANLITNNAALCPQGWILKGLTGEGFVPIQIMKYGSTTAVPGGVGIDPFSKKDIIVSVPYGRGLTNSNSITPPNGFKGIGTIVKWNCTNRLSLQTLSSASTRDRVVFGDINLPWNGSVPLI